jgi:hypothetical protein
MKNLNEELVSSLLESIKGEGEPIIFSPEEVEADKIHYAQFFEESIRKERRRSAEARKRAFEIYLD